MANNPQTDYTNASLQYKLFDFVALWVTVTDVLYFSVIYFYIPDPWPALGCALLFPGLNVPALKLSNKFGKPFISYTLTFTLIPMFFTAYLAGPGGPGWVMCISAITASHIMVQNNKLKKLLDVSFVVAALAGSWLAGWSLSGIGIIFAVLVGYALIVTRIFSFLVLQNKKLETEVLQRQEAESLLRDALNQITSSIRYASRIQQAILPEKRFLDETIPDHFVMWNPRDVVGGDVYWTVPWGNGTIITLIDCTGHGVPGAFMTLIAKGAFERSLATVPPGDPGALIQKMHQLIQTTLNQHHTCAVGGSDDGLDMGICYVHQDRKQITFAGASFPLFVVENGTARQIKGARKGVGYRCIPQDCEYKNTTIEIGPDTGIYMTTDGLIDQVGGDKRRGFGKKRFMRLLESLQDRPMRRQEGQIFKALIKHQGKEERRDDVAVIGFRLQ